MKIQQTGLPAVPAGYARDDILKGVPVILRNNSDAGASWRWVMLWRPPGSTAVILNPNNSVANFTPDLDGVSYRVQLSIDGGRLSHGETQTKIIRVRDASGFAAPAVGERGSEANYLIGANQNTAGWADEFVRRYLRSFNNRNSPLQANIGAGANHTFQLPWTLPDAMLLYAQIVSSVSADLDITFAADAALSRILLQLFNIDGTDPGGYKITSHTTLTYEGDTFEDDKIYVNVRNNGGAGTDVRIGLRIGAT